MNADTFMFCYAGQFGKAGYVDVNPSGYRVHSGGIWSMQKTLFKLECNLDTFRLLTEEINADLVHVVRYQVCKKSNHLFWEYLFAGQLRKSVKIACTWLMDAFRFGIFRSTRDQIRWMVATTMRKLNLK